MRLIEETEIQLERLDYANLKFHPNVAYEYVPGCVGVATIIRDIAVSLGKFTVEDAQNEDRPIRMLVGMGWEWGCAALYPDMCWQPGVFSHEGVMGHPDGLSQAGDAYLIEEFKYTWKSIRQKGKGPESRRDILDEWIWLQQEMGYINILNRAYGYEIDRARTHVCYGRGNYEWSAVESYVRYTVEFSQEDLDRNWKMLQKRRMEMKGVGVGA